MANYRPEMSDSGVHSLHSTAVVDESGKSREISLTGERPLTIYLDKKEIVTLMTMGAQPELLTLGYLRNQGLIQSLEDVIAIQVEWDIDAVAVTTHQTLPDIDQLLSKRTVTSGCGQGTMFGHVMDSLDELSMQCHQFNAEMIYQVLGSLTEYNKMYKKAGAVHGCALCSSAGKVEIFVEDVGRHNAVDAISGWMWLEGVEGEGKIFYTTGRLTSEMVIKVAQMQVPLLLSRSGVTEMGLSIAQQIGIGLVARAKGKHFLVFNGLECFTS
ncbi:MAG: sulfurtransferase FdhD [Gammaproteobacteria bacterium]|nr:MAG: sulfurtransferase FdhD [Gammaproteobacteria bacterium]RKZ96445.1 MAG: sulfurtransferase FdhD [Gammaproteobacteria bacterium]